MLVTCEGDGAYPYCGECAGILIGGGERRVRMLETPVGRLLSHELHEITVNLNDTFDYATADAETLAASEIIADFYGQWGWYGLVALCAVKRGTDPIGPVVTDPRYILAYEAAAQLPDEYREDL